MKTWTWTRSEGALHLVRTREVATQFCGNDASIQTAYVPTTMGAAHPAFKAMTEATDAALDSLSPSFLEQPPPPPPQCRTCTATRRNRT